MSEELRKALRCRNYAEELRIIAADKLSPENSRTLLRVADSYERMADSFETIEQSKRAISGSSE